MFSLFATVWTIATAPLSMGFSGKNTGLPCPSPRDLFALVGEFFTTEPSGSHSEYNGTGIIFKAFPIKCLVSGPESLKQLGSLGQSLYLSSIGLSFLSFIFNSLFSWFLHLAASRSQTCTGSQIRVFLSF